MLRTSDRTSLPGAWSRFVHESHARINSAHRFMDYPATGAKHRHYDESYGVFVLSPPYAYFIGLELSIVMWYKIKMHKKLCYLTSTGLSSQEVSNEINRNVNRMVDPRAVIVSTASKGKSRNKYVKLAKQQLQSIGVKNVTIIDIEKSKPDSFNFDSNTIVYVSGGNVFKLMTAARRVGFDGFIKQLLDLGGMYIGVSAGAVILGNEISFASTIYNDVNVRNLKNTKGFNCIDKAVLPHFDDEIEMKAKERGYNEENSIQIPDGKFVRIDGLSW